MARRYQNVLIKYTADDGTEFKRPQRLFKNSDGSLLIPTPDFITSRIVQGNKNAIWGKGNSSLRRTRVRFPDENNLSETAQQTFIIPQNPQQDIPSSLKELKTILDNTFGQANYCFDYNGESRE